MTLNDATLRDLLQDDWQAIQNVRFAFIGAASAIVKDMHKALADNSTGALLDCCHKLKSAARGVGADELADLCTYTEGQAAGGELRRLHAHVRLIARQYDEVRELLLTSRPGS